MVFKIIKKNSSIVALPDPWGRWLLQSKLLLCLIIINLRFLGPFVLEKIFSSPKLKAQVSFSDRPLSGVRLAICLSICKLLHF
jgi:hypothetical protein